LLDKNERVNPYSNEVVGRLLKNILPSDLCNYPDQTNLYEKLSNFLDIDVSSLLLTAGSDAGLKYIFDTFVSSGDEVVHLNPTYAMIRIYVDMFGARSIAIPFTKELKLDTKYLISSINSRTKLVLLVNPNQPTGTVLQHGVVQKIAERAKQYGSLFVIDEAYIEFSDEESALSMVSDYSNLVVMRTFSKAWGLAGVRLGYLAAQGGLINELKKVKPLLDINILAIKSAEYLLEHCVEIENYVNEVKRARLYAIDRLKREGYSSLGMQGNFLHVEIPERVDVKQVAADVLDSGYRVRIQGGTATILDGCIRFTLGTTQQVEKFLDKLIVSFKRE
jgi:histidinol-phosphate aminotransferase